MPAEPGQIGLNKVCSFMHRTQGHIRYVQVHCEVRLLILGCNFVPMCTVSVSLSVI